MKADLHSYLKGGRESLLWKLDGLGEYDIRRPLTPTATNLLGLVKHAAAMEILYFGVVFSRPFEQKLPYVGDEAETNADMWASADETREEIVALYGRAIAHADTTIDALALDEVGHVPWWGDAAVTLHHVLVHVIAETQRHAGHADIVRELIDGTAGLLPSNDNLPHVDESWWLDHRQRVEQAALDAGKRSS
ncbi:DinB family protein [Micromonospora sp. NBC_00362]|uniref:DinB family protein n=1 Tax=Micromonospora sp. NBC_00362 TaxID=2975975 RepID=UPI00224CE743|nr:DinB family protein [Micromonospora sp. NBC_00362]MCX5116105.1 DinB family protein [Micromonospora sp. NBC_00362]